MRRATDKNPNYGTPHLLLASLVEGKEAVYHLEAANAINPFDPEIHRLWGENLRKLKRLDEAQREERIFEMIARPVRE